MSANPIPDGLSGPIPYLVIDGVGDALEFYKNAFGAEVIRESPAPDGKRYLHAQIRVYGGVVMMSDEFPEWGAKPRNPKALNGSSVTIHLYVEDTDAAIAKAQAAGATVTMEPMDAFWGDRFGKVEDPFGHEWEFATHVKDMTPDEIEQAQKAFLAGGPPSD